jgi:hypothetical protein
MPRYLFRVQYLYADGTHSYEPVCVDAATEQVARDDVEAATERYRVAAGATTILTRVLPV